MRKIHLRWYLTPVRLVHMSSSASRTCWRQCGQVGSLLHMWWSCPLLSNFWSQIADLIIELTGYHISLSPELAILDINLVDIPLCFRTIIHHILLAARISIARIWKQPTAPSISEIIKRVNFSCHCELTLTPLNPSSSRRHTLWTDWVQSKYYFQRI